MNTLPQRRVQYRPSLLRSSISTTIIATLFLHLLLFYPLAASTSSRPVIKGWLNEESRMRLGSRPPNCHNKCNWCHPCMAVQAPTTLATDQSSELTRTSTTTPAAAVSRSDEIWSSSTLNSQSYSNYKPLGWKCRCRDRIYNP